MKSDSRSILINSVSWRLSINHLFVTVGLGFVFGLFYRLGIRVTVYVPLRNTARKTLYELSHPYFLPEMIV